MNTVIVDFLGCLNIALPIAVLYYYFPSFVLSLVGIVMLGFVVGASLFWLYYNQNIALTRRLQFSPSGDAAENFNTQIKAAGLNPQKVAVRYGYNDDQIGVTIFNMVVVDQMLWKNINDPEFLKAQEVIKMHILPTLSEAKKKQLAQINEALTEPAQKFIFKHELGHVADNYGYKKLLLIGLSGFISVVTALYFAAKFIGVFDSVSVFLSALFLLFFIDTISPYLINYFFKSYKELQADRFAAKYSTKEEINAAADFFEKYEVYAQEYRNVIGDSSFIPLVFRVGYVESHERVKRLRKLAALKDLSI